MARHQQSPDSLERPSSKRTGTLLIVTIALASVIMVLIAASLLNSGSSQQRAIDSLSRIGETANQRTGSSFGECDPSFGFDERGPRILENILGRMSFRNAIRVGFRQFDDQQLIESIPHLQQFPRLRQIGFHSPPDQAMFETMRAALPNVTFFGPNGKLQ
jgi:hypothetical protein